MGREQGMSHRAVGVTDIGLLAEAGQIVTPSVFS